MKELYIFLTHHFQEPFLSFIRNFPPDNCIILFDADHELPSVLLNIPIVKVNRISTSYDNFGHSMYISFLRQNRHLLGKYDYFWVIENDVYVPSHFMLVHQKYDYDLMVPEYGVRDPNWIWLKTLSGFKKTRQIGVTGVIIRFSSKFLKELLKIDIKFFGYMEAVLPHICIENNLTIQCFLPEYIGLVTTERNNPVMNHIMTHRELMEQKLYHPFK
jgi:hypothetical protein